MSLHTNTSVEYYMNMPLDEMLEQARVICEWLEERKERRKN
jgi:hypothetical protein